LDLPLSQSLLVGSCLFDHDFFILNKYNGPQLLSGNANILRHSEISLYDKQSFSYGRTIPKNNVGNATGTGNIPRLYSLGGKKEK